MAKTAFLKHLDQLRCTYRPHPLAITPVALHEMEFNFKEIGRFLRESNPHDYHAATTNLLYALAARSLDLLQHNDYPALFDGIVKLQADKNAGYAGVGATDPWANFRLAEWLGVSAFTGCVIRMTDKFVRVTHLSENPDADRVGESIKDTLHDLVVYCMIAVCLWEEERTTVQCEVGQYT